MLREAKRKHAHIIFFQETHFMTDSIPKLADRFYTDVYHVTVPDSKTKVVSIVLSNNQEFSILDTLEDPEGRFLFLKGVLGGKTLTLANIYGPNLRKVSFMSRICD